MTQHAHSHHTPDVDWGTMVAVAEQEAEVLYAFLDDTTSLLAELAGEGSLDVRRILDIGCGPGVATCALAERFEAATVVAADGSPEMLANVAARAARFGLADRVDTRHVELPDGLAALGRADLVWASMVLHHVGDEAAALRGLRALLDAGGLLALVEFGDPMRLLPEEADLGRPGLWERLDAARSAWLADMRAGLPGSVPSGDHRAMVEDAGFEVLVDRVVDVHVDPPLDDRARRAALAHLQRMREHVEHFADAGDVEAIDALIEVDDPAGILHRPDAFVHASRRLVVARAR